MAYIRTIDEDDAEGDLARQYAAAVRRAGKVFNVVKLQSQNPRVMRRGIALYVALMHGESALSRAEREMLAVAVSRYNDCHY